MEGGTEVNTKESLGLTPTPETDASSMRVCLNWENKGDHIREVVPSHVSRKLERQLYEAWESLDRCRQDIAAERALADRLADAVESFLPQPVAPLAPLRESLEALKEARK